MKQRPEFPLHGAALQGAVDLGARRAAAERQARRAAQPATGAGADAGAGAGTGYVVEVTDQTFNAEVVERSRTVPVVMDLWAEWCEPCKKLGPILERLAQEAAGRWILAKVDVDANPQLRAALRVQSIPMVVAVAGGQMVDGFLGALPEQQIRAWLDQLMAVVEQHGLTGPGGPGGAPDESAAGAEMPPADPEMDAAEQAMARGDLDGAAAAFQRMIERDPQDLVARTGLAQVELLRRVRSYDETRVRRAAAERPGDVTAQCQVADLEVVSGRAADAFDRMIGAVRRTSGDDRERARTHLLQLFEVFPPGDPDVNRARSRLGSVLF